MTGLSAWRRSSRSKRGENKLRLSWPRILQRPPGHYLQPNSGMLPWPLGNSLVSLSLSLKLIFSFSLSWFTPALPHKLLREELTS